MDHSEFIGYIIGPGSVARLVAALLYAYLGAFLMLLTSTTKRDVESIHAPVQFSWSFLFSDNSKRILATIIFIFIFIRFSRELLGANITMYAAVGIGLASDKLAEVMKQKNILGPKKNKAA
jgi:hypothetical protein